MLQITISYDESIKPQCTCNIGNSTSAKILKSILNMENYTVKGKLTTTNLGKVRKNSYNTLKEYFLKTGKDIGRFKV